MKFIPYLSLLTLLLLSSCSAPKPAEFQKMGDVVVNATMPEKEIILNVDAALFLSNPNSAKLDLQQVEFDAFVNGKKIGHHEQKIDLSLPASEASKQAINFTIPLGDFFGDYKPTMAEMAGTKPIKVKIDGNLVAAEGVKTPVSLETAYDFPVKMIMNYLLNRKR